MRYNEHGKETLSSFVDRFVALAKRLEITNQREIITGILIALPVEVQGDIEYLDSIKNVSTVEELMKIAQRYDGIVSKRFRSPDNFNKLGVLVSSISQEELKKALNDIREEFRRQHEETLAAIGSRSQQIAYRRDGESRRCYNCQNVGHLAMSCNEPKRPRQSNESNKQVEMNQISKKNQVNTRDQTGVKQLSCKDYTKINQEAREMYEKKYGKPGMDCPICQGYHFVYHCPLKSLKD